LEEELEQAAVELNRFMSPRRKSLISRRSYEPPPRRRPRSGRLVSDDAAY
jgi:hypothetical protein